MSYLYTLIGAKIKLWTRKQIEPFLFSFCVGVAALASLALQQSVMSGAERQNYTINAHTKDDHVHFILKE